MNSQSLKKDDLVITSRGRYGLILEIDESIKDARCKVKIGNNEHWIFRSQLRKAVDTITFKVFYSIDYMGKECDDTMEVVLPKNTRLYISECNLKFENVIKEHIENALRQSVKIKQVLIS